jgi:FKBP-type peptidyl-prolyl cis-trans isomerases 1
MDAKLNELQKIDNKVGTGAEATKGTSVVVHYTGWLYAPAAPDHKGPSSTRRAIATSRSFSRSAEGA